MYNYLIAGLQFAVVSLHYISSFLLNYFLAAMTAITLQLASVPAGQWMLSKLDSMLQMIAEAAVWSSKDSERSTSWTLFLPLLVLVHWTRLVLSTTLYILLGTTVSPADINKFIKPSREFLQDNLRRGSEIREERMEAMSNVDPNEFLLYRLTKTCICRPVATFTQKSLYFIGLIPSIKSSKDETAADSETKANSGEQEEQKRHHHHHEHHENHENHY